MMMAMAMAEMVGHVTLERYRQLVAEGRELVELASRCQWRLGDAALEIEPIRPRGGSQAGPGKELFSVEESLARFPDDLQLAPSTVRTYRTWPPAGRRPSAPTQEVRGSKTRTTHHTAHRVHAAFIHPLHFRKSST
jgi:hypothetical protein